METIFRSGETILEPKPIDSPNKISTTFYNIYNFIPLGLWKQVIRPTNIYFIVIMVINFIPEIRIFSIASTVFPVAFVLLFAVMFDWLQDFNRYRHDKKANGREVKVFREGRVEKVATKDVQVGDFVVLGDSEEAPADFVILGFNSPRDNAYIETASLDGERGMKPKMGTLGKFENLADFAAQLRELRLSSPKNVPAIDEFSGSLMVNGGASHPLTISSFVPRSARLKSTHEVLGVVVFVGKDTKLMLNTQPRKYKTSLLEKKIGRYVIYIILAIFAFLILLSGIAIGVWKNFDFGRAMGLETESYAALFWYTLLGYFILVNTILPISLIVTLQMIKVVQKYEFLSNGLYRSDTQRCEANSIEVHEELGQIQLVLSDKTGTLTQNVMIGRRLHMGLQIHHYGEEPGPFPLQPPQVSENVMISSDGEVSYRLTPEKMIDLFLMNLNTCHSCYSESVPIDPGPAFHSQTNIKTLFADQPIFSQQNVELGENLASLPSEDVPFISNPNRGINAGYYPGPATNPSQQTNRLSPPGANAIPFTGYNPNRNDSSRRGLDTQRAHTMYLGSSSDEVALLTACKDNEDFYFIGRTGDGRQTIVESSRFGRMMYRTHLTNHFDSERKMMSVVVDFDGHHFLFVKGADSSILPRLRSGSRRLPHEEFIVQGLEDPLRRGHRTMVFAARLLSDSELGQFADPATRPTMLDSLEEHLTLLGSSAVEDRLQDQLHESLEMLRTAGIPVWVITGDKGDTARNVAVAAGLFDPPPEPVQILRTPADLARLDPTRRGNLIVDGQAVRELLTRGQGAKEFVETALEFRCVVFSRTTPNQKVEILRLVRRAGKVVLAIGDGANDVNMIQEANVGVGVAGSEGRQAASAADFVVPAFKYLPLLMFRHGRLSYYRNTLAVLYFFYKNFLFTVPQFLYAFYCDYSRTRVYPEWYQSFFNLFFTALPVAARAVSESDLPNFGANNRFTLTLTYYYGSLNRMFTSKKFFFWIIGGTIEALVLFFFIYFGFRGNSHSFAHGTTYNFISMLLFSVIVFFLDLKIIYMTRSFTWLSVISYVLGVLIYFIYMVISNFWVDIGFGERFWSETWGNGAYWVHFVALTSLLFFLNLLFFETKNWFFPNTRFEIRKNFAKVSKGHLNFCVLARHREETYPRPVSWVYY